MLRLINIDDGQPGTDKEVYYFAFFSNIFLAHLFAISVPNGRSLYEKNASFRNRIKRRKVRKSIRWMMNELI